MHETSVEVDGTGCNADTDKGGGCCIPAADSACQTQPCGTVAERKAFPKQIGNAWGVASAAADASPQPSDSAAHSPKKRSSVTFLSGGAAVESSGSGNASSKPKFADIMAQQESEGMSAKASVDSKAKVSFGDNVESEEERMMRLAIEASLQDQKVATGFDTNAKKMPPPALKNSGAGISTTSSNQVSFSNDNVSYASNDDMDEDMRMAISLSLQEAEGGGHGDVGSAAAGVAVDGLHDDQMMVDDEDDRKPSALPLKKDSPDEMKDDMKPAAVEMEDSFTGGDQTLGESSGASFNPAAAASVATAAAAASAAAASSSPPNDESERLALALHQAELESQSASAAAEAASLQLAMQLQEEEDARHSVHLDADAARMKREDMCHGAAAGVRTVGRDEFFSLKAGDRRKQEERGMGKLLSSNLFSANDEADDYEEMEQDDWIDEEGDGIRMNSQSSSSSWQRVDKHTFIGPNNELRTKHDTELKHRSNAVNLLGSHGAKRKDASKSASVSDRAYNAFKRAESRQSGFKKGVARQGHGRAENMNAGKTRGGAMDGNVLTQIAAAVNAGLISGCNGVVKEGKEALVYHADGGSGRADTGESPAGSSEVIGSEGYDVAVKVFKRIAEFKGRGSYVDGDPRYHKQKFKTNDQREQVVLWAEKENRNLLRARRAGVACPKPLQQKENILFMRFLGEGGWPSPQLREIDIKKGSAKWTTLYCQTLVAIRRLYHCARLVHADLSEYNLLVVPHWQVSRGQMTSPATRTDDDEALQVVLIDFGQAVEVNHPSAATWLGRDLSTVRNFFVKQGIKTLSVEAAEKFVTEPFEEPSDAEEGTADEGNGEGTDDLSSGEMDEEVTWRHSKKGWDDAKEMETLANRLRAI
ncbi:hypothetical protein ACHAXT_001091 [Thalassiosira profunda]